MKNIVATYRKAGLEAKWKRNRLGAPIIIVRDPNAKLPHQREKWWYVTSSMFELMKKVGVKEGFNQSTLLGDAFSV